ncbi:hypothetical protein E5676_scaffold113G00390 [Cucumis melo var. makuwa]|uniref:Uncharacterized protein n=1 Tax=Cucumis melo var. makuwa TaxID=1194695 RepID=A0A5D3BU97_CUCMM|nr:hypothetical protein E5676_scaffold113G00390 [Cucumis melo var. makuwa]
MIMGWEKKGVMEESKCGEKRRRDTKEQAYGTRTAPRDSRRRRALAILETVSGKAPPTYKMTSGRMSEKYVRRTIFDVQPARHREYTSPNIAVADDDTTSKKHDPQRDVYTRVSKPFTWSPPHRLRRFVVCLQSTPVVEPARVDPRRGRRLPELSVSRRYEFSRSLSHTVAQPLAQPRRRTSSAVRRSLRSPAAPAPPQLKSHTRIRPEQPRPRPRPLAEPPCTREPRTPLSSRVFYRKPRLRPSQPLHLQPSRQSVFPLQPSQLSCQASFNPILTHIFRPIILGVPLEITKDQLVPTGAQIARVRGRASPGAEVEVRTRASWRVTRSDRGGP